MVGLELLHRNDMFLPRPGCAAGIVLAGTVYTHMGMSYIKVWWLGATWLLSGGRRPEPAWPLGAPCRLRLSPLHCSNNMLLPQPGCAAGTALAGIVCTYTYMPYQGLVAGGNLLAE